jgi:preprotein translocase subunit YajC
MKITETPEALFQLMAKSKIVTISGFTGIIQSIEMEDGSGFCFNVKLRIEWGANPQSETVFVRCSKLEDSKIMA